MRYTGWRRRLAQHLQSAEKIADAVSRGGEEEYATGVLDAVEFLEMVLTYEECRANCLAVPEIALPALLERAQDLKDAADVERLRREQKPEDFETLKEFGERNKVVL